MEDWNQGPDALYPATSTTSTKLNEAVIIKNDSKFKHVPVSLYTKVKGIVTNKPHLTAYAYELDGEWKKVTYEEHWKLCNRTAKSLIKLNLKVCECVAILGFNAPAWMLSFYGTVFAGGVVCGIYTTNSPEACEYILKDSGAHIVVVENQIQLDKILKCRQTCQIDKIIMYSEEVKNSYDGLVISWDEFMKCGQSITDEQLQSRIKTLAPNRCMSLIYTSGTTGSPKAVMINHDNAIFAALYIMKATRLRDYVERFISYLPLSHIAEQILDFYVIPFLSGAVYFARPDALKGGSLVKTICEVKPTFFFGVPRVWEKIHEKIEHNLSGMSPTKLKLFNWATRIGFKHTNAKFNGHNDKVFKYWLADKLVLRKIRHILGFDELRSVYSGAAPINRKTLEFFMSLGIPLCEVYGMSECTGPQTIGMQSHNRITSVGNTRNEFSLTKISGKKDEHGNGEICMYGRHVFMGYLNDPRKTKDAFDDDGFLLTGDTGRIDEDGFLFVTGRIKELIVTTGGENIAPVPTEEILKEELHQCISNCMLIGDRRKYLTILITLKSKIDSDTLEPLDELDDDCREYIKKLGSTSKTVSDIIKNKSDQIYSEIDSAIKRTNLKAISNANRIQKYRILSKDFSLVAGELGPTLKLRRLVVAQKYQDVIEEMYNNND